MNKRNLNSPGAVQTVVGLSGGIDSAVAALLLKEHGHRVIGVTLRLWDDTSATEQSRCCSPEAMLRAQAVATHLGIPHVAIDITDTFRRQVVDYFVSEYSEGRTPNPCVKCNARVRFDALKDAARRLGASLVATGHYARIAGKTGALARARDRAKDQSYVLAELPPAAFRGLIFPLGGLAKTEVRAIGARAGLLSMVAAESQEICFIADNDYRAFLRARLGERPGPVVDREGRIVGHHRGTYNYTVGQRRGLGGIGGQPLYVAALDAQQRRVVVGPRSAGLVGTIVLGETVVHRSMPRRPTQVQLRSLGGLVPIEPIPGGVLVLLEPAAGVAPGQTAVVYAGDKVILAGTIVATRPWAGAPQAVGAKGPCGIVNTFPAH